MCDERTKSIRDLIETYNRVVKVVDADALNEEHRAYGGVIRSVKGKLQEHITEELIGIAWKDLGGDLARISIDSRKHRVSIQPDYIDRIPDHDIKQHILDNIDNYYYGISVDKQVYIDNVFVMAIECKAYTENAMIKRILVDFSLLSSVYHGIICYLFQLESQLGGDYHLLQDVTFGSTSTHTLMSYFSDVQLKIVTLLEGERKVDCPIHRPEHFKELKEVNLQRAVDVLQNDMRGLLVRIR